MGVENTGGRKNLGLEKARSELEGPPGDCLLPARCRQVASAHSLVVPGFLTLRLSLQSQNALYTYPTYVWGVALFGDQKNVSEFTCIP